MDLYFGPNHWMDLFCTMERLILSSGEKNITVLSVFYCFRDYYHMNYYIIKNKFSLHKHEILLISKRDNIFTIMDHLECSKQPTVYRKLRDEPIGQPIPGR